MNSDKTHPETPNKTTEFGEIKLTSDEGVSKTILTAAPPTSTAPEDGDRVEVHYVGTLLDGSRFDSSRERNEPFKFALGEGSVIKAWDIGVKSMKIGEKSLLFCAPDYAYGQKGSDPKIPPNSTLKFEIELLAITPPSFRKAILTEGVESSTPNEGAEVTLNITGKVEGNSKVTLFTEAQLKKITLDDEFEPKGLSKAVKTMKRGEKASIKISPGPNHYPKESLPEGVEAQDHLVFDVEVISFENKKELFEMSDGEKLEEAKKAKQRGNELLKRGRMDLAARRYEHALSCLERLPGMKPKGSSLDGMPPGMMSQFGGLGGLGGVGGMDEDPKLSEEEEKRKIEGEALALAALNNISLIKEKKSDHTAVVEASGKALKIDETNVKALYRRGKALASLGRVEEALVDMENAARLKGSALFQNQCAELRRRKRESDEKVENVYRKMFGAVGTK